MKKIIYIIGILFLTIVVILNLIFTANLDASEHIDIKFNYWIYTLGIILLGLIIYFLANVINTYFNNSDSTFKKNMRKYLLIGVIVIYAVFNIVWVIMVNPRVIADSIHVCNIAQAFYRDNVEEILPNMTYAQIPISQYMEAYHQQISLSFIYSIIFRVLHFDVMEILRIFNIISNIFIVIALYMINNQLSKTYKTNKTLLLVLILTFISLPMLNTFIYGDIPSLALCLFAVYFMMKYTETKKIKYPIFSSIFTMIAYMMRMNSLIFIIATVIYLLMNLFKDILKRTYKENLINILIIVSYIVISIIPASLVQNYYLGKYNIDKDKSYPTISYLLMAMEESPRGNGWYSEEIAENALRNSQDVKDEYINRIKDRISYFLENLGYTFNFYTMKITSMWTENTYSAIRNNVLGESTYFENAIEPLTFYQKTLLVLSCLCCLIVLIQNRKNISLDLIFLITIFIGGFAFHILWEAKSRYIIPYVVILIPVASIQINNILKKNKA